MESSARADDGITNASDSLAQLRNDAIAEPVAGNGIMERALIGDELRLPVAWCDMGSCISRHTDPQALGEADIRARAIAAGWRVDGLGRLACPRCQQRSWFWSSRPVTRWDRNQAVTSAAGLAARIRRIAPAAGDVTEAADDVPAATDEIAAGPHEDWRLAHWHRPR